MIYHQVHFYLGAFGFAQARKTKSIYDNELNYYNVNCLVEAPESLPRESQVAVS